jgi:hypothetical protein
LRLSRAAPQQKGVARRACSRSRSQLAQPASEKQGTIRRLSQRPTGNGQRGRSFLSGLRLFAHCEPPSGGRTGAHCSRHPQGHSLDQRLAITTPPGQAERRAASSLSPQPGAVPFLLGEASRGPGPEERLTLTRPVPATRSKSPLAPFSHTRGIGASLRDRAASPRGSVRPSPEPPAVSNAT